MSTNPTCRFRLLAPLFALLVFGLICAPLIFSQSESNYVYDEQNYHLPAVRQIEHNWPKLDINADSLSATAPGYHYFLATIAQVTGSNTPTMRTVNFGISAALLGMLLSRMKGATPWVALCVIAPLGLSNFFVKSSSWVVTDNAALLGLVMTLLALNSVESPARAIAGVSGAVTVFIRQNYAWLSLPLVAREWLRRGEHRRSLRLRSIFFATLPVMTMGLLYWTWGGMAPARWTEALTGERPFTMAPIAMALASFGLLGPSYIWLINDRKWTELIRSPFAAWGAALGGLSALVGPTGYSYEFGRWGGYIWEAVRLFPAPADRSLLLVVLSAGGGAIVAILGEMLAKAKGRDTATLWGLIVGTWLTTGLLNRQIFQRYFEPPILVFLILWFIWIQRSAPQPALRWKPMAGLSLIQLLLTVGTAYWNVFA